MIHTTEYFTKLYPSIPLVSYIHQPSEELRIDRRRAVIVCPGGGYQFLSDREAEPVALQYFAAGFNVFILRYAVGAYAVGYAPLIQSALAVRYVRENAERFLIDPDYVFIAGFSAGGHLAASCGTLWNIEPVRTALGADAPAGIGKPTGTVLCYPVLIAGVHSHAGSINTLCGKDNPTAEERDRFSLEKHVDATTAPAFIWHTYDDGCVPVENSLLYALALREHGIPFEMHIYPHGPHGLALCNEETWVGNPALVSPAAANWMRDSIRWIKDFQ